MNDVGGSGTGLRPKSSRGGSASDANFEYDDSEWDVGIGNLIIDLDADIEKNNEANRNPSSSQEIQTTSSIVTTRPSSSGNLQMHIPQQSSSSTNTNNKVVKTGSTGGLARSGASTSASGTSSVADAGSADTNHSSGVNMELSSTCGDKSLKMKIKRTKPGTKSVDAKHEIVKSELVSSGASPSNSNKLLSNNPSNEACNKTYNISSACSNKSLKEKGEEGIQKSDGSSSLTDGCGKLKTAKRISTPVQKKIKIGGNNTTGNSNVSTTTLGSNLITSTTTTTLAKNDIPQASESKSHSFVSISASNNTGNNITSSTIASSTVHKTEAVTVSVSIPSVTSSVSSAFVKATPLKVPTQQQSASLNTGHSQVHDVASVLSGASNTNIQSLKSTTSSSSTTFGHSHPAASGSPNKGDKLIISSSSTSNGGPDKVNQAGSNYAKKTRIILQSGKKQESDANKTGTTLSGENQTGILTEIMCTTSVGSEKDVSKNEKASSKNKKLSNDACVGTSVGTVTEPDCLGPCEPGTSVTLEGIVWHETENGVLVVNVTWRGKTYVGTLLDCTKNEWASPRFCDSPTSDLETRTPKNRGKRGRAQGSGTPVLETNSSPLDALRVSATKLRNGGKGRRGSSTISAPFLTPLSPLKVDPWPKRKTRGSENDSTEESTTSVSKSTKRLKITSKESSSGFPGYLGRVGSSPVSGASTSTTHTASSSSSEPGPYSPTLIECPEPNCSKKYKHINGLKYHQSHAHTPQFVPAEDSDSNMSTTSTNNLLPCSSSADGLAEPASTLDAAELELDECKADDESELNFTRINVCDESSSSAPTTPLKSIIKAAADDDLSGDLRLPKATLENPLTITKDNIKSNEEESVSDETSENKEFKIQHPPHSVVRTPILTVPSFVSQNRPVLHHQVSIFGTSPDLSSSSETVKTSSIEIHKPDKSNVMSRIGQVPWQPHANSNSSLSQSSASLISSIHSSIQGPTQITSTTSSSQKHGMDLNCSPTSLLGMKKLKHKKKSKDKRDRERDGKSRGQGESLRNETENSKNHRGSPNVFHAGGRSRDERKSSSDTLGDESDGRIRPGGDSRDRDDPQSPAYSDISDANDSGPESDLGGGNKDAKIIGPPGSAEQLSKDMNLSVGTPGPHGYSSFYSTGLYSPYSIGENSSSSTLGMTSATPLNVSISKNTERDKADETSPGKPKFGTGGQVAHSIIQGLPDERRSPKLDYHPKYLPQQYYSYPYSNFHGFEQSPYGLLPENPYSAHSRAFMEEKERELQIEQLRKGRASAENTKDGSVGILTSSQIKQEPVGERERGQKDSGIAKLPSSTNVDQLRRSGNYGASSGCSKHQKDYNKRSEKDDKERHGHVYSGNKGDTLSHKSGNGRNSGHHQTERERQSTKQSDSDNLDKEKDREKNEGAKPTMETTGPPPPPTAGSFAYIPPTYLQGGPFGLPFDPTHPLYRQVIVPGPYPGSPYGMHPSSLPRFPPTPVSTSIPLPEDLSRPVSTTSAPVPPSKALDLLQHHAAQYYATHKIHELQERALKSPSPHVPSSNAQPPASITQPGSLSHSSKPSSPTCSSPAVRKDSAPNSGVTGTKGPELSKDVKPSLSILAGNSAASLTSDSSRSPPTQHHVHSHTHHHTHIGYPIIPTVPPQYSPHYPHVIPPAGPPTPVIPPFSSQKPA